MSNQVKIGHAAVGQVVTVGGMKYNTVRYVPRGELAPELDKGRTRGMHSGPYARGLYVLEKATPDGLFYRSHLQDYLKYARDYQKSQEVS